MSSFSLKKRTIDPKRLADVERGNDRLGGEGAFLDA